MSVSSFLGGQNTAYGYGRLGILQQKLLTGNDVDRLVMSHSPAEFERVLNEIAFTEPVRGMPVQKMVAGMEQWLRRELNSMLPEPENEVFSILWLREDSARLSYLLKKHFHLTSNLQLPSDENVEDSPLGHLVLKGESGEVMSEVADFILPLRLKTELTVAEIDTLVAKFVAEEQVRIAHRSGKTLIERYVRHLIDLQNLRTVHRLHSDDVIEDHLLPGGSIDFEQTGRNNASIAAALRLAGFNANLTDLFSQSPETGLEMERAIGEAIGHEVVTMRSIPLSVESLLAYGVVAMSQLKVLRTVLIGKNAGLRSEEIRTMLPPFLSTSPFAA